MNLIRNLQMERGSDVSAGQSGRCFAELPILKSLFIDGMVEDYAGL